MIQNIELATDRDELALQRRVDDLVKTISVEHQREFLAKMDELKSKVEERKKEAIRLSNIARVDEIKQRILTRLNVLVNNGKDPPTFSVTTF